MHVRMTIPVKSDPAMLVMVLTSSKTVMKQFAAGVSLILIITHHPNAQGKGIPTGIITTMPPQKLHCEWKWNEVI